MDTLALTTAWDLDVDAYGNIKTFGDATPTSDATGPGMRLAQDVATRCLAWYGEVYYDTTQGIRYANILGAVPNMTLIQNAFNTEALKVDECETALANFTYTGGTTRKLGGTLNVSSATATGTVSLA